MSETYRLTQEEMRDELRRQVQAAGGLLAWCRLKNIENHAPVSLALKGQRDVGPTAANAAGFFTVVVPTTYLRIGG